MKLEAGSTAFVFPGQGSQSMGMGMALAEAHPIAKETFQEADSTLGFPLSGIMWEGPREELDDTLNTQPALYVHSVAALRVFWEKYPDLKPAVLAGHSLGELTALYAAGALSFIDGLRLVRVRGELMKRAGDVSPGGMAAILGLDIPSLEVICAQASSEAEIVQVANDNCPGQVVISGAKAAVERAVTGAKSAGAKRAIPLAISIAAHSPLMGSIQSEWAAAVDVCQLQDPEVPIVSNVHTHRMATADEIRADIKKQMGSRVRWRESVQEMVRFGVQDFVEIGSGSVLLGLIRRVDSGLAGYPLGNPDDFTSLAGA